MTIDKAKIILDNFKDIKNFANFNFLICHKKLFNKEGLLYNIGSYFIIVIIFFNFTSIFIFYIKQFPLIKIKIKDIITGIKGIKIIQIQKKIKKKIVKRKIKIHKNKTEKSENKMILDKKNKENLEIIHNIINNNNLID